MISDVIAHVTAPSGIACSAEGVLIDSVCWSEGSNGVAATVPAAPPLATSVAATLRNDTLIAAGAGSDAAQLNGANLTTTEMDLYNVIARGAGEDILVQSSPSDATGSVIVTAHDSNFAATRRGAAAGRSRFHRAARTAIRAPSRCSSTRQQGTSTGCQARPRSAPAATPRSTALRTSTATRAR